MTRTLSSAAQVAIIQRLFASHFPAAPTTVLGAMTFVDRVYELRCLIELLDQLKTYRPLLRFVLSTGTSMVLKEQGGPIDRADPHIKIYDHSRFRLIEPPVAEIWTNIEFWALSDYHPSKTAPTGGKPYGTAHELDILLLKPGCSGRPRPRDIVLGVEAKHRKYGKGLLKELLGVRREMTFVRRGRPHKNRWAWWTSGIEARPASGLIAYCAYPGIRNYRQPAAFFGLHMVYLSL